MRADARRMISSANISLHQVRSMQRLLQLIKLHNISVCLCDILHQPVVYQEAVVAWQDINSLLVINILSWILCVSWADPATKADDICFQHANIQGDKFGNCGLTSSGEGIKCSVA